MLRRGQWILAIVALIVFSLTAEARAASRFDGRYCGALPVPGGVVESVITLQLLGSGLLSGSHVSRFGTIEGTLTLVERKATSSLTKTLSVLGREREGELTLFFAYDFSALRAVLRYPHREAAGEAPQVWSAVKC